MGRKNQAAHAAVQAAQAAVQASDAAISEQEETEEGTPTVKLGPMFHLEEIGEKVHVRTRVVRIEPIDEGRVGDLPPDCGEVEIERKWGGGGFDCQAIGSDGKVIARRTIRIAGEPRFDNDLGRRRYKDWKDQNFPEEQVLMDPGQAIDQVALEEARHNREIARIRAEAEVAVAKAKAEADASLARAKAEAEASISRARAERAEQEEIDERRRKKEREERRLEREEIEAREDQRRQREREERRVEREEREEREDRRLAAEMTLRREELSHRADPITQFGTFAKILADVQGAGAGSEDPVTAAITNLPNILQQVRETGMAVAAGNAANRNPQRRGQPAAGNGFDPARGDIALVGPIAQKAQKAIEALQKAGIDPEVALAKSFEALATARPAQPKIPPAPPAPGLPPKARPMPPPPMNARPGPQPAPPAPGLPPKNGAPATAPEPAAEVKPDVPRVG